MFDFLDVARELVRAERVPDARREFEAIFRAISALQQVHSKSQLDLNNVETVFAAFEMADILGSLCDYPPKQIAALPVGMRTVIARTIEETLRFQRSINIREAPSPYYHFGELLKQMRRLTRPRESSCIITFNYDLAAGFILRKLGPVDYALTTSEIQAESYPLLKLHGSLNWFSCLTCQSIKAWDIEEFVLEAITSSGSEAAQVKLSALLSRRPHATKGHNVDEAPVLVPPTWNKGHYHRILSSVWARAAEELKEAENLFVIGYSLPATDEFFRHLYSIGTAGPSVLQRFWVFNPDLTGQVEQRYRNLLGPGAQQRFQYFPETFSQAIKSIAKIFTRS